MTMTFLTALLAAGPLAAAVEQMLSVYFRDPDGKLVEVTEQQTRAA
jgi:hypothetical protein